MGLVEMMKEKRPLVIIRCLVYNHEPFLRKCLDGVVMQQTSFPFYAVVHDDASTDNSAAIIREYAEKYPEIIHPIYEVENLWQKGDDSLMRIMTEACHKAKYVAFCEGDDYWTDPLKLQKQVDFMEAHPDCVICSHKFEVQKLDEEKRYSYDYSKIFPNNEAGVRFEMNQIYSDFYLQFLCVMYRVSGVMDTDWGKFVDWRDNFVFAEIMKNGGWGYIFNEYMGVYRKQPTGIYSGLTEEKRLLLAIDTFKEVYRRYPYPFVREKLMYQYENYLYFLQREQPNRWHSCVRMLIEYHRFRLPGSWWQSGKALVKKLIRK